MFKVDRLTKALLAIVAAAILTAGALVSYSVFAPRSAGAEDYSVKKIGACNAFLPPGTKPWCAEVVRLAHSKWSGEEIFTLAIQNQD
jgi:hypothetical protein